jgi:hypothetical protein
VELYTNYAVAQFPGVGLEISAAIGLVEVAINTLIGLLKPAVTANVTLPITYSRFKRLEYIRHNNTLKTKIRVLSAAYAKAVHA